MFLRCSTYRVVIKFVPNANLTIQKFRNINKRCAAARSRLEFPVEKYHTDLFPSNSIKIYLLYRYYFNFLKEGREVMTPSVADELDGIALQRLFVLEQLLKTKQQLAELLKISYLSLGKSRVVLGCHSVSSLRIPQAGLVATRRTQASEKTVLGCSLFVRDVVMVKSDFQEDENEEIIANKKPINWFSALPPQSLRQAESGFVSSIQLAASCVSLQAELMALDQKYLELRRAS